MLHHSVHLILPSLSVAPFSISNSTQVRVLHYSVHLILHSVHLILHKSECCTIQYIQFYTRQSVAPFSTSNSTQVWVLHNSIHLILHQLVLHHSVHLILHVSECCQFVCLWVKHVGNEHDSLVCEKTRRTNQSFLSCLFTFKRLLCIKTGVSCQLGNFQTLTPSCLYTM